MVIFKFFLKKFFKRKALWLLFLIITFHDSNAIFYLNSFFLHNLAIQLVY